MKIAYGEELSVEYRENKDEAETLRNIVLSSYYRSRCKFKRNSKLECNYKIQLVKRCKYNANTVVNLNTYFRRPNRMPGYINGMVMATSGKRLTPVAMYVDMDDKQAKSYYNLVKKHFYIILNPKERWNSFYIKTYPYNYKANLGKTAINIDEHALAHGLADALPKGKKIACINRSENIGIPLQKLRPEIKLFGKGVDMKELLVYDIVVVATPEISITKQLTGVKLWNVNGVAKNVKSVYKSSWIIGGLKCIMKMKTETDGTKVSLTNRNN